MPAQSANTIVGFDVGGAHLKIVRAEGGRIVAAQTFATPLWLGLDRLEAAFAASRDIWENADVAALTMTGELSDVFASRDDGVRGLLDIIARGVQAPLRRIYAGRAGFLSLEAAASHAADVASANWHATAALVAQLRGEALFVDMGSTTTDILALRNGRVANRGYTDAERLSTGELVYTGFTRTFLFGVADNAPVEGRVTPLMTEYFASMADAHRIMAVLDESDDLHGTADGKEKTVAASTARLARMVGRDAADLSPQAWRIVAEWFSERQLRRVHDAAVLVAGALAPDCPIVAAGAGRWQIDRLAGRMGRPCIDFASLIPADDTARHEASNAAAASAVALLAGGSQR